MNLEENLEELQKFLLSLYDHSPGTASVMADRQIRRAVKKHKLRVDEYKDKSKRIAIYSPTRKWFEVTDDWRTDNEATVMMGAICGDVAGSVYERHNVKFWLDKKHLIKPKAKFTDDTVMTCAVAEGLRNGLSQLPQDWETDPKAEAVLFRSVQKAMQYYGRQYLKVGYGKRFLSWILSPNPLPYQSIGNGSAMRVSYAGWIARSLEEAEKLAEITARVTHNTAEGIAGAKVVAGCIFLLRNGSTKEEIHAYANRFFTMDFSLREIRKDYSFDGTCAGSVPVAIKAFLEGKSFVDVIAKAIWVGGDSDTIAAIAGSIAEVIYPIPQGFRGRVIDRVDKFLLNTVVEAVDFAYKRLPEEEQCKFLR